MGCNPPYNWPDIVLFFIMLCGFINLMLGSASAQWAITAPIFVPMLMLVGYAPETIQTAYRIGDSVTNLVTPVMSYFGLILAVACRYQKNLGIGTLIATMLPYTLVFSWVGQRSSSCGYLVWSARRARRSDLPRLNLNKRASMMKSTPLLYRVEPLKPVDLVV